MRKAFSAPVAEPMKARTLFREWEFFLTGGCGTPTAILQHRSHGLGISILKVRRNLEVT